VERKRLVALALVAAALVLAAGGAIWFTRFASQLGRDPGLVYRDPRTLETLLKRANDAERAGDRATAITTYRFVAAVGQGAEGGQGIASDVAPGLRRLGVADTLPGPPR
jgi:hypothetical protein